MRVFYSPAIQVRQPLPDGHGSDFGICRSWSKCRNATVEVSPQFDYVPRCPAGGRQEDRSMLSRL
jgi:hypothetical protein